VSPGTMQGQRVAGQNINSAVQCSAVQCSVNDSKGNLGIAQLGLRCGVLTLKPCTASVLEEPIVHW
jgi:hypothetical protein